MPRKPEKWRSKEDRNLKLEPVGQAESHLSKGIPLGSQSGALLFVPDLLLEGFSESPPCFSYLKEASKNQVD